VADTPPDPLAAARDAIRALADGYIASLPAKLDEIDRAWVALTDRQWSEEAGRDLHRAVHSIAGSARVFGLPAVGEAARAVEHALEPLLANTTRPGDADLQAVARVIRQLRDASLPGSP
jgi:HPt (histidine-containing phosphotransfer) domain-containing protein